MSKAEAQEIIKRVVMSWTGGNTQDALLAVEAFNVLCPPVEETLADL